jgi:hypothetical protein
MLRYHPAEIATTTLLRFESLFFSWILECFALGAMATVVCDLDGSDESLWLRDSHQRAREHLGALFSIALLTSCAFLAGLAAMGVVDVAIAKTIGWARFSRFVFAASLIGYGAVASIVSWFGAAIPLVLRGNSSVWIALKKSLEASDGYPGFLFLLVIESLVGSYLAWYVAHSVLLLMLPG